MLVLYGPTENHLGMRAPYYYTIYDSKVFWHHFLPSPDFWHNGLHVVPTYIINEMPFTFCPRCSLKCTEGLM